MFKRSLRNLVRSPLKSILIIFLLTLSIGLALIMLTVNGAFQNQLDSLQANISNNIQVRPAGSFALLGGGEPIQDTDIATIAALPHVTSVQKTAQAMYTGNSLVSSINGGRLAMRVLSGVLGGTASKMPIIVMGFQGDIKNASLLGGAQAQLQSGRYFSSNETDANVAVMGQALAAKNSINIGSQVDINGTSVQIVGTFISGQQFGDGILVMPYDTVERLFDLSGATTVYVQVDSSLNVDSVASAISQSVGSDKVDVVTSQDAFNRVSGSIVNASQTSQTGMIAGFIIAGAIVLFSVFLSVRQRVKEIGIMKAIGASNLIIGLQFGLESLLLSVIAAVLGALLTFPLAQQIGRLMAIAQPGQGTGVLARLASGISVAGVNLAASPLVFLYALIAVIVLAVLASILSSWYVGRVKPAEVLRNE